jgi:hypothetical protein
MLELVLWGQMLNPLAVLQAILGSQVYSTIAVWHWPPTLILHLAWVPWVCQLRQGPSPQAHSPHLSAIK